LTGVRGHFTFTVRDGDLSGSVSDSYPNQKREVESMAGEELSSGLKVGQRVPDLEMDSYDPNEMFFGKVSLEKLKAEGKWTVFFFYPADFTFV
jgi:hypothetical protein